MQEFPGPGDGGNESDGGSPTKPTRLNSALRRKDCTYYAAHRKTIRECSARAQKYAIMLAGRWLEALPGHSAPNHCKCCTSDLCVRLVGYQVNVFIGCRISWQNRSLHMDSFII